MALIWFNYKKEMQFWGRISASYDITVDNTKFGMFLHFQVGREANEYFMTWQDPNPLDVSYVGYSTGFGSTGVFKFCNLSKLLWH